MVLTCKAVHVHSIQHFIVLYIAGIWQKKNKRLTSLYCSSDYYLFYSRFFIIIFLSK